MEYSAFFMNEVPAMLSDLKSDTSPAWGEMNAPQMVDHLRKAIEVSLINTDGKIVTPEDKLPAYKSFLMSDKPFKPGAAMPEEFKKIQDSNKNLEDTKIMFLKALVKMQVYFEKHPDFVSVHSYFGELNTREWMHLHRKHILHHFRQFELIKD